MHFPQVKAVSKLQSSLHVGCVDKQQQVEKWQRKDVGIEKKYMAQDNLPAI